MKDLSARWAVAVLLAPVLVIVALMAAGEYGCGGGGGASATTTTSNGTIEVGFTGSVSVNGLPSSANQFQRIMLNVIAVRLNPSTDPNVSESDPGWQTIAVPPGVGNGEATAGFLVTGQTGGGNFSSSGGTVQVGQSQAEIQIDMNLLQGLPVIFNAAAIQAQTYNQIELILDSNTPANLYPLCGGSGSVSGEGCIVYSTQFSNTVTPSNVRFNADSNPINLAAGGFQPVVLNVDLGIDNFPTLSNEVVGVAPNITLVPNGSSTPVTNPVMATLTGTVTNMATTGESVTAEIAGTDNIVASITPQTNGTYVMLLPAEPSPGTLYDIYAAGSGRDFQVASDVALVAGNVTTQNFTHNGALSLLLTGALSDSCSGAAVPAATLELLAPDNTINLGSSSCTPGALAHCVAVASASTDENGVFPMPGNTSIPPPFNTIAAGSTTLPITYELVTTASGYDRTAQSVTTSQSGLNCTNTTAGANTCNFNLSHGFLNATVQAAPGETQAQSALVFAEESGTNDISSVFMPATIPEGVPSTTISMLVPDTLNLNTVLQPPATTSLDLFATSQDLFNGTAQAATAHSIPVVGQVPAPAACATAATTPVFGQFSCGGHGSISGSISDTFTNNDFVTLSLPDPSGNNVQIESAAVGPSPAPNAGLFGLCAPAPLASAVPTPAPYSLTHYQATPLGTPIQAGPTTALGPLATPSILPTPSGTPTACVLNCDNPPTNPCFTCVGTQGVSIP